MYSMRMHNCCFFLFFLYPPKQGEEGGKKKRENGKIENFPLLFFGCFIVLFFYAPPSRQMLGRGAIHEGITGNIQVRA